MVDGLLVAVGVGFAGAMVGGPSLAYGVRALPLRWRRTAEWVLIAAAAVAALLADLLLTGPTGGVFVYVLACLPGVVAFLAFRTLLATALVSLAPLYFVIGHMTREWPTFVPDIALDRAIPLWPEWMLVYGSLYVFAFLMPLLIVGQQDLLRATLKAFLTVMLVSYLGFLLFPTAAPRPAQVLGDGFAAWALRLAYEIDPPHGCMPSLHVAYAFVSALACWRVHRGVGTGALCWAALIGLSTLFTKQHYTLDVLAGALQAYAAYLVFLRSYPRDAVPAIDRQRAPVRALIVAGLMALAVAGFWVAYHLQSW
jgi:membrane-associated phospholipid phosphatase